MPPPAPFSGCGKLYAHNIFSDTQGLVTPNLIIVSGRNSHSSENLCLYYFPASSMKIQSKMKALSCLKHFPHYKSRNLFWASRMSNSLRGELAYLKQKYGLARNCTYLKFYAHPGYLQGWWKSDQNWRRYHADNIFPIISQRGLLVAMETKLLIRSPPEAFAAFPQPQWCYITKFDQDWLIGLRYIQVWKCGQRRTDDGHLLYCKLNLCQPSVKVS